MLFTFTHSLTLSLSLSFPFGQLFIRVHVLKLRLVVYGTVSVVRWQESLPFVIVYQYIGNGITLWGHIFHLKWEKRAKSKLYECCIAFFRHFQSLPHSPTPTQTHTITITPPTAWSKSHTGKKYINATLIHFPNLINKRQKSNKGKRKISHLPAAIWVISQHCVKSMR